MSWKDLLTAGDGAEQTLPWIGGRTVHGRNRAWSVRGPLPEEHGWHRFDAGGSRHTRWLGPGEPDPTFEEDRPTVRGYLVGDRLVPDGSAVRADVHAVRDQTVAIWLVERGLDRFARALAAQARDGSWIYVRPEFPLGPEPEVLQAWLDQASDVDGIPGVSPALDLAFRFLTWRRMLADERRQEQQLLARMDAEERAEQERISAYQTRLGEVATHRSQAWHRFEEAARDALAVSGATLLDHREGARRHERVVQFRFRDRRFECVVDRATLRVIDAGICLLDYDDHTRGDTLFTLESLPAVIDEAIRSHVLHVYRHVGEGR